jgi:hypothetical protein
MALGSSSKNLADYDKSPLNWLAMPFTESRNAAPLCDEKIHADLARDV